MILMYSWFKIVFASQDRSSLFSSIFRKWCSFKLRHMIASFFEVSYSNCLNSSPLPKRRNMNSTICGENALKMKRYLTFVSTNIMSEPPLEGLRKNLFKWSGESSSSLGSVTLIKQYNNHSWSLSHGQYQWVRRALEWEILPGII